MFSGWRARRVFQGSGARAAAFGGFALHGPDLCTDPGAR